jgi:hypothetical protein
LNSFRPRSLRADRTVKIKATVGDRTVDVEYPAGESTAVEGSDREDDGNDRSEVSELKAQVFSPHDYGAQARAHHRQQSV